MKQPKIGKLEHSRSPVDGRWRTWRLMTFKQVGLPTETPNARLWVLVGNHTSHPSQVIESRWKPRRKR